MGSSVCTTISSDGSDPAMSTITRETTVIYSTVETGTCELKILSEISPNVFLVSADYRLAIVTLDMLETSLAGVMLLVEYDGQYKRLWTWFWKYGLSRDVFNTLHVGGEFPGFPRLGRGYILIGCDPPLPSHESSLCAKWSGRLFMQGYKGRGFVFFEYLWHDIRKILIGPLRYSY